MTPSVIQIGAPLLAGFLFGLCYFYAVRVTAENLASGKGWAIPALLTAARLAGAVLLSLYLVQFGALPLLAGFVGFLLARAFSTRAAREQR